MTGRQGATERELKELKTVVQENTTAVQQNTALVERLIASVGHGGVVPGHLAPGTTELAQDNGSEHTSRRVVERKSWPPELRDIPPLTENALGHYYKHRMWMLCGARDGTSKRLNALRTAVRGLISAMPRGTVIRARPAPNASPDDFSRWEVELRDLAMSATPKFLERCRIGNARHAAKKASKEAAKRAARGDVPAPIKSGTTRNTTFGTAWSARSKDLCGEPDLTDCSHVVDENEVEKHGRGAAVDGEEDDDGRDD
jgi:hypothetical protein